MFLANHTLTDADRKKAAAELKEDPEHVKSHIESLRRWLVSMGHLSCPHDDEFLLMFLRVAKFDHMHAQKRLDNFCTIRSSSRGLPKFFHYPNPDDPIVDKILHSMQQVPIGRSDNGELFLIYRPGAWNIDEVPMETMMMVNYMAFEAMMANPVCQIHGIQVICDFANCGHKIIEAWSDPHLIKDVTRIWQDCYPLRMKGQTLCHEPKLIHALLKISFFFLHEKQKKRFHRVENDFSKVFKKTPSLKKIFPKEYGGDGKTMEEYNNDWIKYFKDFYRKGSPYTSIKVDESKRPKETMGHLVDYSDYVDDGHEGSYTKFDDIL